MIQVMKPSPNPSPVFEALRTTVADSGHALAYRLRDLDVPTEGAVSEEVARALGLVDRFAKEWAPAALGACGFDEGVWGEITLLADIAGDDACEVVGQVFDEVYGTIALEGDYVAYCAVQDAKWIANCAQRAVGSAGVARELLQSGDYVGAMDAAEDAAVSVGRALTTRTHGLVLEALDALRTLREVA